MLGLRGSGSGAIYVGDHVSDTTRARNDQNTVSKLLVFAGFDCPVLHDGLWFLRYDLGGDDLDEFAARVLHVVPALNVA